MDTAHKVTVTYDASSRVAFIDLRDGVEGAKGQKLADNVFAYYVRGNLARIMIREVEAPEMGVAADA